MYKAKGFIAGAAFLIIAGGVTYWHFHNATQKTSEVKKELTLPALDQGHDYFKEKMEFEYKKKVLAGPIAIQENIVKQLPDNLEAKKKLAKLYLEVGDTEKAKPLLESLIQAGDTESKQLYEQHF